MGHHESPNNAAPAIVGGIEGEIEYLASGFRHTLVATADGSVYAFGFSRHGRLGCVQNQSMTKIVTPQKVPFPVAITRVACGFGHSAAVAVDGSLFTWGYGGDGALGLGQTDDVWIPTRVDDIVARDVSCGGCHTLVLDVKGVLYAAGAETCVGPRLAGSTFKFWLEKGPVSIIHAGSKSSLVVLKEFPREFFAFGSNEMGYLGLPDWKA